MPENDKKKKQQNIWSWVIRKYPNLSAQYGEQVPLDDNGLIPRHIAEAIKTEERASKPQVGPGGVYPGQKQLPAPQPVNWAEVGRDITSGIANIGTIPLLGKGQGAIEDVTSKAFGVEPRSFDVPEDGGMIRKIADPIMPTLAGLGTAYTRFADPIAATAGLASMRSWGTDPWESPSNVQAYRDAGYGPLESISTEWQEGDIPWHVKLPFEIFTSPEELIPGFGIYAGAAAALGRRTGKLAAKEVAEEVVEEAAPVVARQVEEPVVARRAGEVDPRLEEEAVRDAARRDPATQATIGAVGPTGIPHTGTLGTGRRTWHIDESFLIPETLPISAREMGPAERVIPETEKVSAIDGIKNILDQDVPTRVETEEVSAIGEPFMSDVVGQTLEELGTIIDRGGTQKATVLRKLDAALNKASSVTNELVDGIDEVRSSINQYFTTSGSGSRAAKQQIFDDIQNQVRDLSPVPQQPIQGQFGMEVGEAIDSIPTYRANVVQDLSRAISENPLLYREDIIGGTDALRDSINNYIQGSNIDQLPVETAATLFGREGFNADTAFNRIEEAINNLGTVADEVPVEEVARQTPIDQTPTGVPSIMGRTAVESIELPESQAFTFKDPMSMEQFLASGLKRSKQGEETIAAVKQDAYPVSDAAPVTEAARSYKNQLIKNTNDIAQAVRDMMPADFMSKAVFKPASWLTDRMGQQLVIKYEGALNGELARIQDFVINGARNMERLGLGKRQRGVAYGTERSFVLDEFVDWGRDGSEGPIKVLYQALHGENNGVDRWLSGDGMAHPAMAPDKRALREEILSDLKSATDYEESMRIDFDPNVATVKDYFYRGWKAVDEKKIRDNMSRLAANPSYLKSRSTLSFTEMMDIGFEPLHIDPFAQAAFAQQMGTKYRLQTELADILQNPNLNIAHYVENKEALGDLKAKHGVAFRVPEVGPAFEGKGFMIVDESDIGGRQEITGTVSTLDKKSTKYVMKAGQIAVPVPVANALESIFRGGATSWQKTFSQKIPFKEEPLSINVTKIIDNLVFIPKRLKLFGSLFQATDFMRRIGVGGTHGAISAIWDGIDRGMTPGQAFDMGRVALEARGSIASIGRGWWEIVSSYGAAGKTDYYRNLLRTGKEAKEGVIKGAPIIEGTDFYWVDMIKNGLNVRDLTILPGEDMARIVNEVASNANFPRKMGRFVKELEYSSRRGLFDRVYPAAITTDVKYNLLPMAMRAYPHATPDAIMALVARQANLKYSTLLRSQSELNQFGREMLSRVMFSVNENEGLIRQLTRSIRGEETKFWRQYWVSAAVFFALTANIIHGASTLVTGDGLQPLPTERYIPIRTNRKGWWNYGYNSRFLNPDLPITSRSGERAMMDMLGQLDTAGRMFDFQEFPLDSFISSRKGATAGAFHHLFAGKDFYGRETDKFGWTGRGLQFMYDIAAPIGVGEAGVGLAREAFGEQELPSVGRLIAPGARVKDVLPVAEPALGLGGMLAEMSGENIKAPTVGQLQRRMILNVYPDSDASTFKDLDADKVLEVERHIDNEQLRNEIKQRSIEGAEMDNAWNEQRVERDEVKATRRSQEDTLIHETFVEYGAKVWEPSNFRNRLKEINLKSRVRQEMLTLKYGEDPFMKKSMEESLNISDEELEKMRIETPIKWAWNRYLRLLNEETPPGEFKDIDYDAFNVKLSKEQETWGEELIDRFDAYRASKSLEDHADEVNEYYEAMGILEEGNWFDNPSITQLVTTYHERMPKRKDGTGLLEEWNKWQSAKTKERSLIETQSAYRDTIKIIKARKAALRNLLRMQGVTLESGEFVSGVKVDQILIKWFGSSPAHRENIVFYTNLYGQPPKRMAS